LLISVNRELTVRTLLRAASRAVAEGNAQRAAQSFLKAWEADPEQTDAAVQGAGYLIALGKTPEAVPVLARVCAVKNTDASRRAEAMLKELKAIEPSAGGGCAAASSLPPARAPRPKTSYQQRIPRMVTPLMLAADGPSAALISDTEPVALLETFLRPGFSGVATPEMLDQMGMPQVGGGEHPYDEYRRDVPLGAAITEEPSPQEIEIPGGKGTPRMVRLRSTPYGAEVTVNDDDKVVCHTPCDLRAASQKLKVSFALERYKPQATTIQIG
jgi:hypothetical protein